MTTLTTVIVLLAIAALFISSYQIAFDSSNNSNSNDLRGSKETEPRVATDGELNSCLNHLVGIPLLSIILGWAITTDLNRLAENTFSNQYVLITSLVIIGISSILSLYSHWRRQGKNFDNILSINGAGIVGWIVWIISLLASILGIISFYLDYLN